jgi:hypothetical protein
MYQSPGGYNQFGGYHQPPMYQQPQIIKQLVFSKTQDGGGGGHHHNNKAAMSALTLLSFLFFLNILQQCLKDQMATMNPTVAVMTAGRIEDDSGVYMDNEDRSDMQLIKQPIHLGVGVGRAYPAEVIEDNLDVKYDNASTIFKNLIDFSD